MRVLLVTLAIVGAVTAAAPSLAHVAPAIDENNRYIKLSPMGSRLQIAYVVFIGEVPGQKVRKNLDDPQLYGEKLAVQVGEKLSLTVEGEPTPVAWERVAVDLKPSKEHPNALSISMVAWICLDDADRHRFEIHDSFEMPPPGENELVVEPGPGVTIQRSVLAGETKDKFTWIGLPNPMTEGGYELELTVDAERTIEVEDSRCPVADDFDDDESEPAFPVLGIVGGALAALIVGILLVLRRRREP
ncbi:MAG: hypothetical protein KJO07_08090 [Deltaproteobacteria bacterium]|nr:hypothetical protein [Deltaproteobacteria bacterium]